MVLDDTGAGAAGRFKFVLDWTNADSPTVTVTETTDAADADNTQGGADDKYLYFGNGTSKRFYARGGNSYELTLDFDSDWGFLVRTSTMSWAAGTKYGAPDNRTIIRFGEPFTLMSNRSADPANVQFSLPTMYHRTSGRRHSPTSTTARPPRPSSPGRSRPSPKRPTSGYAWAWTGSASMP